MCPGLARGGSAAPVDAAAPAVFGNEHRELERLLMVEARVDTRAIGAREISVGESARAAGALGHVITGELDVDAAEVRAHVGVDAERQIELTQDVLEAARLQPTGRGLGVAMHRVAHPQHRLPRLPHSLDRSGQRRRDLLYAEAVDEGES